MNILAILAIWESAKKFNTGCKETLHFPRSLRQALRNTWATFILYDTVDFVKRSAHLKN